MARAGIGWTAKDLAAKAGVGSATVARFELGEKIADDNRAKMQGALEAAGAQFSRRSGRVGASVPTLKDA